MTTPKSEQSAEERAKVTNCLLSFGAALENAYSWGSVNAVISKEALAEGLEIIETLRLTNERLTSDVERLEGENTRLKESDVHMNTVSDEQHGTIVKLEGQLREASSRIQELEAYIREERDRGNGLCVMLDDRERHIQERGERIKELEAEVERMKKENLILGDAVADKSVELAQMRERLQFTFVDVLGWYQHEATVSLTLTAEKVFELYHKSRLRELSSREQSRSKDERAGERS